MNHYVANSHWGSFLWGFIHTITVVDSFDNVQENMRRIEKLKRIEGIIPCSACVPKYASFVKKLDMIDVREPLGLFYWGVDLHNDVNAKLGKPLWSYEKALKKWTEKQ